MSDPNVWGNSGPVADEDDEGSLEICEKTPSDHLST